MVRERGVERRGDVERGHGLGVGQRRAVQGRGGAGREYLGGAYIGRQDWLGVANRIIGCFVLRSRHRVSQSSVHGNIVADLDRRGFRGGCLHDSSATCKHSCRSNLLDRFFFYPVQTIAGLHYTRSCPYFVRKGILQHLESLQRGYTTHPGG